MQTSTLRSVVMYAIVGLALLAAIILGIQVVKNRAQVVGGNKTGQTQTPQPTTQQEPQPAAPQPTPPANNPPEVAATPTPTPSPEPAPVPQQAPQTSGASTQQPHQVPATGSDDLVIATLALGSLVASAMLYVQSRRRLMSLG